MRTVATDCGGRVGAEDLGAEAIHNSRDGVAGLVTGLRRELPTIVDTISLPNLDKPTCAIEIWSASSIIEAAHAGHAVTGIELRSTLQTIADFLTERAHLVFACVIHNTQHPVTAAGFVLA